MYMPKYCLYIGLSAIFSSPAPVHALTFHEAGNMHMMMETLSHSLRIAAENASLLSGRNTTKQEVAGTTVYSFIGSYDDQGWSVSGNGSFDGHAFSLAQSGNITGKWGEDIVFASTGFGTMDTKPMSFNTSAKWSWDSSISGYWTMTVSQNATTESIGGRIISWFVRAAESIVTYVGRTAAVSAVTGAIPLAGTVPGLLAGEVVGEILSSVTTTISNAILDKSPNPPPSDPEPPYVYVGEFPSDAEEVNAPEYSTITSVGVDANGNQLESTFNVPDENLLGTVFRNSGTVTGVVIASPVPEPEQWVTMALGLALLSVVAARRRKKTTGVWAF